MPAQQQQDRRHDATQRREANLVACAVVEAVRTEDCECNAEAGPDEETALFSPDCLDVSPPGNLRRVLSSKEIQRQGEGVSKKDNRNRVEWALHPEERKEGIDAKPGKHEKEKYRGEAIANAFGHR